MTARSRALVATVAAFVVVAALAVAASRQHSVSLGPRPPAERPPLLLLTSLPLMFGEDFSLKGGGSPTLARLNSRYRVLPISVTSDSELTKGRVLLMAQPRAQTAENLVALDSWVRRGGRVLLLADPLLEWPSKRPLGDKLGPLPVFMDTGLLAHWGLRLAGPDRRGPAERKLGGVEVLTASPGRLSGSCAISADGLVAHCRIGRGEATVVADADLLNSPALGSGGARNLDGLQNELATLEH